MLAGCANVFTVAGGESNSRQWDMSCLMFAVDSPIFSPVRYNPSQVVFRNNRSPGYVLSAIWLFGQEEELSFTYMFAFPATNSLTAVTRILADPQMKPALYGLQVLLCKKPDNCISPGIDFSSGTTVDTGFVSSWWHKNVTDYTDLVLHLSPPETFSYSSQGFTVPLRIDSRQPFGTARWKFENHHPCEDSECANFSVDLVDVSDPPQEVAKMHLRRKDCSFSIPRRGLFGPA